MDNIKNDSYFAIKILEDLKTSRRILVTSVM